MVIVNKIISGWTAQVANGVKQRLSVNGGSRMAQAFIGTGSPNPVARLGIQLAL
jgi:hypothetical protein